MQREKRRGQTLQTRVICLGATRNGLASARCHLLALRCGAGWFREGHPPETGKVSCAGCSGCKQLLGTRANRPTLTWSPCTSPDGWETLGDAWRDVGWMESTWRKGGEATRGSVLERGQMVTGA